MDRQTTVLLAIPKEPPYDAIALGFFNVAATHGWLVEFANMPQTRAGICRAIASFNPEVVVLHHHPNCDVTKEDVRGRIVLGAETDLPDLNAPSVRVDNEPVGVMAARHLIERGLPRFAVFGARDHRFARERADSFERTVRRAGLPLLPWSEGSDDPLAPNGRHMGDGFVQWIQNLPKPVGVLACCDSWGRLLIMRCKELGIRIPDEVAIVGVDNNLLMCELSMPGLSSVAIPWARMGADLALLAERLLAGETAPAHPILVRPTGIQTRLSSDIVAVDDPDVAAALRFIRENASHRLNVPQLLRHVPSNRRNLERRFRAMVGRSIMQELRRVRVDHARRLLATSSIPIEDIARQVGFANAKKLSEAFRKETGTTPSSHRRQFQFRA